MVKVYEKCREKSIVKRRKCTKKSIAKRSKCSESRSFAEKCRKV
jgi:hypothetical protein